jgi:hypothetical protein
MHFAISDYVLDIVQNACESGAANVALRFEETEERIDIVVVDDGKGMDSAGVERALDPFRSGGAKHPGRKVGLGLPFLEQATKQAGGSLHIESENGRGTKVSFGFSLAEIDCPPIGDVPGLFLAALCFPGSHEMEIERGFRRNGMERVAYRISKSELMSALEDLERVSSLALLKEFLVSQEVDVSAGRAAGGATGAHDRHKMI